MFRDRWEEVEKENLEADVRKKLDRADYDRSYKETCEQQDLAEVERIAEDEVANRTQVIEGEEPPTEAEKHMIGLKSRFVQLTRTFFAPDLAAQHRAKMERLHREQMKSGGGDRSQSAMGSQKDASVHDDKSAAGVSAVYQPLVPEQWKEKIKDFRAHSVIRFPRIFQSLFYLLKFKEREQVCERGTNKLQWKKACKFVNEELFARMGDYWPIGSKEENFKAYERLAFIKANLEGIREEDVDEYSVAIGKLLRWMHLAIEVRFEDVKLRRANKLALQKARENAQAQEDERYEKRTN